MLMLLVARAARTSAAVLIIVGCMAGSARAQAVPAPWASADIGSPTLSGSSTYSGGVYSVDAAGTDIWDASDQFHFIYQAISGDAELVARVDSLTAVHDFTNAGVMVRASLSANSIHGYMAATGSRGLWFRRRITAGAATSSIQGASSSAPVWVRIVRQGTLVTGFSSTNGTDWTPVGSQSLALDSTAYVGLAVSSHDASTRTSARFSDVRLIRTGLPTGQQSADIGAPAVAGAAAYSNGTYTVQGAGADIWNTSDEFHYVYQPMSGDGELVARVASISNTDQWAKAGVMVRESLTAGSRHAMMIFSRSRGSAFQRRAETGASSLSTAGSSASPPGWVRLVRRGDLFEAYRSTNGTSWTLVGSDTIVMGETVYAGLAVTSHNISAAATAVFDNVSITTGGTTNQNPAVTITAPANSAQFTAPATVTVTATAADPEDRMASVDFFAGTTLIARDTSAPYSVTWSVSAAGTYALTATAHDADGGSGTSAAVNVTVQSANGAPTVSLTSPAAGATFTAPATIALAASASDPENQLARVEFYSGSTRLATDTSAPYSFSWTGVPAGTYSLTAVAFDTAGASATAVARTVTVSGGTGIPSPWTAADVGDPSLGSTSTHSDGVFTVNAAGVDIWDTSDQFHFIYQQVTGDVEIEARIDALTAVHEFSNAGVMIRSSLAAGSIHGYMTATGSRGLWFRRRVSGSGTTASIQGAATSAPVWVRLVRRGSVLTAFSSTNGTTWVEVGSQTLALGSAAYVGLAVSSHDAATRTTARFSNVRISQPTGIPTVAISSPANGATFTAPATVTISANASDPEGLMSSVAFYAGSTLIATDTSAPYSATWSATTSGTYSLTARATDQDGGVATSAAVTVTIQGANQPPTVSLTSPAAGATFTAPAGITLTASAADPENQLARVEFFDGSTRVATDTSAPYSFTWSNVAAGSYSLTAVAYDTAGASATSAARTITVTAASTPPRLVVFTASSDHATNVTSYLLEIFAAGANPATATPVASSNLGKPTPAANNDITVDREAFFSGLAVGTYQATVTAIGPGGETQSAAISFTR